MYGFWFIMDKTIILCNKLKINLTYIIQFFLTQKNIKFNYLERFIREIASQEVKKSIQENMAENVKVAVRVRPFISFSLIFI